MDIGRYIYEFYPRVRVVWACQNILAAAYIEAMAVGFYVHNSTHSTSRIQLTEASHSTERHREGFTVSL